ncbi:DUF7305 domain-containing protein [Aquibacillus rhizosphaerae]|uniref:Type 4 fimbrial biogenesis protein PilX N-terminal domain-containing protein n=1 Tax=Aquibacillus rhizosphaerae TaxID=3051431 RepID=A0ABT7L744_9BACI|nr:PilX N-terminal domain-containing pilus assembly protein [Aquibacillus sp. LR5S19]MDL4841679.1 hypothetical protein [Aquibacillus sp. LR5S19]
MKLIIKRLSKKTNNEQGFTLVLVMMVLVVLSVLGLGLLAIAVGNTRLTAVERDYEATYYIAEAGATHRLSQVETLIASYYDQYSSQSDFYDALERNMIGDSTLTDFESVFGDAPEANVSIERLNDENPRTYKIISEGEIGKRSRTVERTFTVNWQSKGGLNFPSNIGVYTNTTIKLFGSSSISGNVGTNSDQANTVELDGSAYITDGNIYVPNNATEIAIKAPEYMYKPDREYKIPETVAKPPSTLSLPPFPDLPSYTIPPDEEIVKTEHEKYYVVKGGSLRINNYLSNNYTLELTRNAAFNEIILGSNYTLNIDTRGSDKAIVVDHLNVGNGHINILGGGSLTLYVRDSINIGSGSSINKNGSVENLIVFLKGSNDSSNPKQLTLSHSQVIKGSIYAEDANIHFTGGGGFQGHIFTAGTNVVFDGGVRTGSLIVAPNADFRLLGGAKVNGAVITNSYYGEGGTNITYQEVDISHLPFISNGDTADDLLKSSPPRESN